MSIKFLDTNSHFESYSSTSNYVEFQNNLKVDFCQYASNCLLRPIRMAYGHVICKFQTDGSLNFQTQQLGSRIKKWSIWFFAITIFLPFTLLGMALRKFSKSHLEAFKKVSLAYSVRSMPREQNTPSHHKEASAKAPPESSASDIIKQAKQDGIRDDELLLAYTAVPLGSSILDVVKKAKQNGTCSSGLLRAVRTECAKSLFEALQKDPEQLEVFYFESSDMKSESESIIKAVLENCDVYVKLPLHERKFYHCLDLFHKMVNDLSRFRNPPLHEAYNGFLKKVFAAAHSLAHPDKMDMLQGFLKNLLDVSCSSDNANPEIALSESNLEFHQLLAEAAKLRANNPAQLKALYEIPGIYQPALFKCLSIDQIESFIRELRLTDTDFDKLRKLISAITAPQLDQTFIRLDAIREIYPVVFEEISKEIDRRDMILETYRVRNLLQSAKPIAEQITGIQAILKLIAIPDRGHISFVLERFARGLAKIAHPEHMTTLFQSFVLDGNESGDLARGFLTEILKQEDERKISSAFTAYWPIWQKFTMNPFSCNLETLNNILIEIKNEKNLSLVIDSIPAGLVNTEPPTTNKSSASYEYLIKFSYYEGNSVIQYTTKQWLVKKILVEIMCCPTFMAVQRIGRRFDPSYTITQNQIDEMLMLRPYLIPESAIPYYVFKKEEIIKQWRQVIQIAPQQIISHLTPILPPTLAKLVYDYSAHSLEDYRLMTQMQRVENARAEAARKA